MGNILLTGIMLLMMTAPLAAQHKGRSKGSSVVEAPAPPLIYISINRMPQFQGDAAGWIHAYIHYPDDAREAYLEGRVEVLFEIRTDGSVQVLSVRRSSGNASLDAEARRVIAHMPLWKPAMHNGRPINYKMVLPVVFKLN